MTLTWDRFHLAIFQLADLWVDSLDVGEGPSWMDPTPCGTDIHSDGPTGMDPAMRDGYPR